MICKLPYLFVHLNVFIPITLSIYSNSHVYHWKTRGNPDVIVSQKKKKKKKITY